MWYWSHFVNFFTGGLCEDDAICPFANQECKKDGAVVTTATPEAKCECKKGSTESGPDNLLCEGKLITYSAQCSYRHSHALLVKILRISYNAPTMKFSRL